MVATTRQGILRATSGAGKDRCTTSAAIAFASAGSSNKYHKFRLSVRYGILQLVKLIFGLFNSNAVRKYCICQLPTARVIFVISSVSARQRAKFVACRQMPVGPSADDTPVIRTCIASAKPPLIVGAGRSNIRGSFSRSTAQPRQPTVML